MIVTIDLTQHLGTITGDGTHREYALSTPFDTTYWSQRFFNFKNQEGMTVSVTWKVWAGLEQFVEVLMLRDDQWVCVGRWSYIASPQVGTSQTSKVRSYVPSKHSVRVVGNPHGDWESLHAPRAPVTKKKMMPLSCGSHRSSGPGGTFPGL